MSRSIEFKKEECVLNLSGPAALFSLKRKVRMPYKEIKSVFVDTFDPPFWMLRLPGTAIAPLYIYEGSYLYRNEWYFLSFERRIPLFMVEFAGKSKYKYLVVQLENPKETAAELRRRIQKYEEENGVS
ncbi:hypothetical protein LRR81_10345 [Metabacillus sp. GX 13764]|uniref:hypothetical protein n=1 Tax=Metabacillus kandeliae TaxID=2900151 RepID=UPI001E48B4E8|nr:hypothetical protein [Metabacillus kandeliae]MCD7034641.1 hypothetical protein [Metabacillus kandeliae]